MAKGESKNGSRSICSRPKLAPHYYHWFRGPTGPSFMAAVSQIFNDAGMSETDFDRCIGEFRDRIQLAREGRLKPSRQVKGPMDKPTNLAIFEIRWSLDFGKDEVVELRVYHAEPKDVRSAGGLRVILGLHMHRKNVSRGAAVRKLQDAEVAKAAERWKFGKESKWGL